MTFRITSIHAFISVGDDDEEGVIGAPIGPRGEMMPLIAADEKRLRELAPIALALAQLEHLHVKLIRFTHREEISDMGN